MIFWIGIVACVIAFIYPIIQGVLDGDLAHAILGAIFAPLAVGCVAFVVILITGGIFVSDDKYSKVDEEGTYELVSMADGTETHGKINGGIFLTSGFLDGRRTINYAIKEDGAIHLEQSIAEDSKIIEGSPETKVDYVKTIQVAWWWAPTDKIGWSTHTEYTFHVPEGSVSTEFVVDNN